MRGKYLSEVGPAKGELSEPKLILASDDQAAIDVEGVKLIQSYLGNELEDKNVWNLIRVKRAVELGLGPGNEEVYEITTS